MRVTWLPAPGKVLHYRLSYSPQAGGRDVVLKVPSNTTTTIMRRLLPMTTYDITVHPMYKRGEGKARQGVGTTRTLVYKFNPPNGMLTVLHWRAWRVCEGGVGDFCLMKPMRTACAGSTRTCP